MHTTDFERIKQCIDSVFVTSAKNPRRKEVAEILCRFKGLEINCNDLRGMVTHLEPLCSGGFYTPGETFSSLTTSYLRLSHAERSELDAYYRRKIKEFEASLQTTEEVALS